jgi:hypothetical protein
MVELGSGCLVYSLVLIKSEESRHELMAIIPVGLVAVHDVDQELYYSQWFL